MAQPIDPKIHAQYLAALRLWDCGYYIMWKQHAREFVEKNCSGVTTRLVGKLMYEHVRDGGRIHQIAEKRPQWLEWKFHYDLYVSVAKRKLYIETVLIDDDPNDCSIVVVSVHDP